MKRTTRLVAVALVALLSVGLCSCDKENNDNDGTGTGTDESSDWVDLGLPSGLQWATRNVGASSPTDYGNYYAWGETSPKDVYDWSTYCYCNGSSHSLTKYCGSSSYGYDGFTDGLTTLQPDDDAATANNGERTPTIAEWEELIDNTTQQWESIDGVNGLRFTGSNGNSIFLPASGYRRGSDLESAGSDVYYWSSSLQATYPNTAWYCSSDSSNAYMGNYYRSRGYTVRAVR